MNQFRRVHLGNRRRAYASSGAGRLLSSWGVTNTSADYDIKNSLSATRARSRELEQNNDYAKRYIRLCVANIVGHNGIKLQVKSRDLSGKLDKVANSLIEKAWAEWCKPANCSTDGRSSWADIQRLIISSVARDGEVIVVMDKRSKFAFSLRVLEADYLDIEFNDVSKNIRMGIEYDKNEIPVAYWLFKTHPGSEMGTYNVNLQRERVDASRVIHVFMKERPSQNRGFPWMHSAMTRLNHLGAYEEAEIVAARIGASKMGFIVNPDGTGYQGDDDGAGNVEVTVEPGMFEQLPAGFQVQEWDPQHPNGNFDAFMKATLRGIASGLNVSYHSLTGDLEEVNYSSIRAGSLDERDQWKVLQQWFIDCFCTPVYSEWLFSALMMKRIPLPTPKYEKYNAPEWYARSWDWVDPMKDAQAAILEIDAGIKTRTEVLAARGVDIEEHVEQLAEELQMYEDAGIDISGNQGGYYDNSEVI